MSLDDEKDGTTVDKKLSEIFSEGYDIYNGLKSSDFQSNNSEFQGKIKKCIGCFEDSTLLVSLTGMFSPNETGDEISTENLKFLLLPFLLGKLTTQITNADRKNVLNTADVYYKDFIKRCQEYEICENEKERSVAVDQNDRMRDLIILADHRSQKLKQYKQKKELDEQIKILQVAMQQSNMDDEIKRDFYMKLIHSSVIEAKEELESIQQELQILEFKQIRENDEYVETRRPHKKPLQPIKPFIITRNDTQKAVFGMGYPSLPVMTVKEFYDQRVREGIFPDPEKNSDIVPGAMSNQNPEEKEEREKEEAEYLVENEDEEYLLRQRAMDEYKDVVRRGDGNRHNRS